MNEEIKLKETLDIHALLEENGGELTPEIEAEYDRLHGDNWSKIVESRVWFIKRMEGMADGLKAEAGKMMDESRSKKEKAERARRSLIAEMGLKGQQTVLTEPWKVSRAKKPPSVELKVGVDLEQIESSLKRHIPEKWELDKMAVKKSLKDRGLIPTEVGSWEVEEFDVTVGERLKIS